MVSESSETGVGHGVSHPVVGVRVVVSFLRLGADAHRPGGFHSGAYENSQYLHPHDWRKRCVWIVLIQHSDPVSMPLGGCQHGDLSRYDCGSGIVPVPSLALVRERVVRRAVQPNYRGHGRPDQRSSGGRVLVRVGKPDGHVPSRHRYQVTSFSGCVLARAWDRG